MHKFYLSLLLSAVSIPAFAQDVLIQDASYLGNGQVQENVDVLLKDGRIVRVAADIEAPNGAEIITGEGQWVTPPLFAPMSSLGLVEVGNANRTNDSSAGDAANSVSLKVSDSFNPETSHIANSRRRGIAHAVVSPFTSGDSIFGGIGMIANLNGDLFQDHNDAAFVRVDLGETGTSRAGGSRSAAMAQLRAALDDAAAYPARYDSPTDGDALSRQDAAALFKAANGAMPLLISAHRASDLLALVDLKEDYPALDIIVVGAAESWKVADALQSANIRVVVDPLDNLPSSFEKIGSRMDTAILLDAAGVDYAISNLTSLGIAKAAPLAQHAGNAVAEGLEWTDAFAAISSTPASWFGVSYDADDLIVWDGDPLNVTSAPTHMWIDGQPQSLESRQTKLRDRYNPQSDDTRPHKYR